MPRALRRDVEDGWHHVMNRGIDHGEVFFDDSDRIEFGQRLADVHQRFGVQVHAYCLLDNHYHLLLRCPDGRLSAAMQRLGSLYTRHVNDRLGRDGALFRGRFHSRLITDERQLVSTARYIHRNALDVRGVASVAGYRWSSHRAYLGFRSPPPWLYVETLFSGWDRDEIDRFIDGDARQSEPASAEIIPAVIEAAELALAARGSRSEARLGAVARKLALLWAVESDSMSNDALMAAFDVDRRGSLRTAISRARQLVAAEPEMRTTLDQVAELVSVR